MMDEMRRDRDPREEAQERVFNDWLNKRADKMDLKIQDMIAWAQQEIERNFPRTPEGHARLVLERIDVNILSARDSLIELKTKVPATHGILRTELQGLIMELDQTLHTIKRIKDGLET